MEKRQRLILVHNLQSMAIAISAGVIVVVLHCLLSDELSSLAEQLASLGQYWISGLIIVVLACLGISFPNGFISIVRSLKWSIKCPPVHFGILTKVIIGSMVYLLLMWAYSSEVWTPSTYVSPFGLLLGLCMLGLSTGYIFAYLVKKLSGSPKTVISRQKENQEQDDWLYDDQPIKYENESRFPQHCGVARRILKKLLSKRDKEFPVLPSVALIGPYGSGKTSICNLVEDIYHKEKNKLRYPEMIFCRFEAWQFLSAEAAVKNLIDVATHRILELIDVSALWRIPEKYIQVVKAGGSWWSNFLNMLFGGADSPEEITSVIGDVLVRLNVRLVIFVDDFDRIEEDTFETQQAVAKALNQLQDLPNTQYIISVGPTIDIGRKSGIVKRSWDLLKLTRFQELVPKIDQEKVISLVRRHRDDVLNDNSCYFPWAERGEGERDPLAWYPQFRHLLSSIGFCGKLLGLVQTPRVLKCMLRESHAAWEGGLKGEINWYDLILANALKAAEPAVFEWIARDRDIFIEVSPMRATDLEREADKRYAKELEQQLKERVESKEPSRYEIVKDTVCEIFPVFGSKLNANMGSYRPYRAMSKWAQRIAYCPDQGQEYIERFFAGEVPEGDIPDQPTLQYIKRIIPGRFNVNEFESLYLDSQKKLTGPLKKLVQFSGLIPRRHAYEICNIILYRLSVPEHAKEWPEPERFIDDVLPNVFTIIDNADSRRRVPEIDDGMEDKIEEWLVRAVQINTRKNPLLSTAIVKGAIEKGYKGSDKLPKVLLEHFEAGFLKEEERLLLPAVSVSRYALAWLLDKLSIYEGYENFRTELTQKLISEANYDKTNKLKERIVMSLVSTSHPARSGEIPIESYRFSVEKQTNERNYDMNLIISALKKWQTVNWSDEINKRAFSLLKQEYNIR